MLDERLIDTLPLQDPIRFGAVAGRGRLVARRAFEPLLPPFLTANPSKNREGFEAELAAMEQALPGQVGAALEGLKALEGNLHPRGGQACGTGRRSAARWKRCCANRSRRSSPSWEPCGTWAPCSW